MRPTEELIQEHTAITTMLGIMAKACDGLQAGRQIPRKHLEDMLEFCRTFADGCHHRKEEGSLFPALERAGIPKESGPIGVMLSEHSLGRGHIAGMSGALANYGSNEWSQRFVREARAYINLLSQHIQKENLILFPMADARLTKEVQEKISHEFNTIETEIVGAGKHEAFHALLKELKEVYLS